MTGLGPADLARLVDAVGETEPGESFMLTHEVGVELLGLLQAGEILTRLVTMREESNNALLARLSASGGRNIDLLKRAQDAEAKAAELQARMDGENPRWHAWELAEGSGQIDLSTAKWINAIAEEHVSMAVGEWYFTNAPAPCQHTGLEALEPFDINDDERPACEHCNRVALDGSGA